MVWDNCFANCAGAVLRYNYEAQKTLLLFANRLTRCMTLCGKVGELSETVARRRRNFFRISASGIHFVKENTHENSPPQANFFSGFEVLKYIFVKGI